MSSTSRRRNSSYVPDFDPYGYSPYDPQFAASKQHRDLADRARGASADGYGDRSHKRSSRTGRRYTPKPKDDYPPKDDDWDTDYDPRDKYYLTGDEKEDGDYFSTRARSQSRAKSASRSQDPDPDRNSSRHHRHHHHHDDEKRSGATRHRSPLAARDHNKNGAGKTDPSTIRAASHRRPKPVQQYSSTSSVARRPVRPRAVSRYSSSYTRPQRRHAHKYPPNASRSSRPPGHRGNSHSRKPKILRRLTGKGSDSDSDRGEEDGRDGPDGEGVFGSGLTWDQIGRVALQAGTIAALKVHNSPGKWVGDKGAKVATAAVSAALVDSFLSKKKPKAKGGIRHATIRQVTEMALGNMVMGPALNKAGARVH